MKPERKITASAPGRINILGNPTDALEGAYAVISAAVKLRARIKLKKNGKMTAAPADNPLSAASLSLELKKLSGAPLLFSSLLKILKRYFPGEANTVLSDKPDIYFTTEIPPESGLAGSTALLAALAEALRTAYSLDKRKLNDYITAELIQRAEEEAGIVCGYADRYACVMGGLAYMDFRGKLHHKPLRKEPLATYERLDRYVDHIPLVICYLGIRRSSGDVHRKFRAAYMKEWAKAKAGGKSELVALMRKVGLTAMKGKYALLEQDWETFGKLMNLNHALVDKAMRLAGFEEGAGHYNNMVIKYALKTGALGAKLSGAGGGGSVLVLVEPGKEKTAASKLEKYMKKAGLSSAKAYLFALAKKGAMAERL